MVYEWDNKRDECFNMYITENKSLEEIIAHFRDDKNFTPSKRAFQARFKEWGFPAKHRPAHKEASLAARIRELWEVNTPNKQMLVILRNEGWDVKERELTKLRKEQGLLLREANKHGHRKRKRDALEELSDQNGQQDGNGASVEKRVRTPSPVPELAPEIIAKREARQARIAAESEERFRTRTRRRRTKVWAGLPPDPEQPPRYPSELTMEECKRELGLDKILYQELRETFETICRTNNVVKKTLCGPDTWKRIKEELISRMAHLQPIFWGLGAASVSQSQKPMALDLLCMDVTKKLRTVSNRVTITDAKNILGVTPQEGRQIRAAFDAILKADHFTSKLEVPREYWDNLKAKWISESPLIQEKLGDQGTDPDYGAKLKSLESIACDVQKRHRDDQTKKDPTRLRKSLNPGQDDSFDNPPAKSSSTTKTSGSASTNKPSSRHGMRSNALIIVDEDDQIETSFPSDGGMSTLASQALATSTTYPPYDYSGMQIDPSLLQAASSLPHHHHQQQTHTQHHYPSSSSSTFPVSPPPAAIPVYFRPSPLSAHFSSIKKLWLDTFHPPHTVSALRLLALNRSGLKGNKDARVGKVEGVLQSGGEGGGGGGGGTWSIDEDDELEAFLGMRGEGEGSGGGGKASFLVEIL